MVGGDILKEIMSFAQWCKENDFIYLLEQWDEDNEFSPDEIPYNSQVNVSWKCTLCGNKWKRHLSYRIKPKTGRLCPVCSKQKLHFGENDILTWCEKNDELSLLERWDYKKNIILPSQIHYNSTKKVWWICEKGHSYEMSVANRAKHPDACPVCSGRIVLKGFNDLQTINPKLAKEWHPVKNGKTTPSDITAYSNKKFWWRCEHGHEWQSNCSNRMKGRKCPVCSNRKVMPNVNDFATWCRKNNKEYLLDEWDYDKNIISPNKIAPFSEKRVWWKCKIGHSYSATLHNKSSGLHCPVCNKGRQTSFVEKCIFFYCKKYFPDTLSNVRLPELKGRELDIYIPSKKIAIEYDGKVFHNKDTNKKRDKEKYILCKKNKITLCRVLESDLEQDKNADVIFVTEDSYNHNKYNKDIIKILIYLNVKKEDITVDIDKDTVAIYELVSDSQINKTFEEWCLENQKEDLLKQWDYSKNGCFTPKNVPYGSGKKFHFICEHGHKWQSTLIKRTKMGRNCPYCAGRKVWYGYNDLGSQNPELAKQWHPTKNGDLKPTDITFGSNKKVWWQCEKGHEWQAAVVNRNNGTGCPYCAGKKLLIGFNDLATTHPELAKQWHPTKNGNLKPTDVVAGSHKKVWWQCEKRHEYTSTVVNKKQGNGCPICANQKVLIGYNDLATTHPNVAEDWHPSLNKGLKPTDFVAKSNKKVWWLCKKCGYEWCAKIYRRSNGSSCPKCKK